jgi:hypothetical protein
MPETIELNAPGRPRIKAWRMRDLAVHSVLADDHKWTITHLPSGLHFGFYWPSRRMALYIMKAMYDMEQNWGIMKPFQIEAVSPALYKLFAENHGRRFHFIPRIMSSKDGFNGYR